MEQRRHWAVTVAVDGEDVLTIESECLSGIANIEDFANEVRTAAEHLLAFIGPEDAIYDFDPDDLPTLSPSR